MNKRHLRSTPWNRVFRQKHMAEYMQHSSWNGVGVCIEYVKDDVYTMYIEYVDLVEYVNPNLYEREKSTV